MISKWSVLLAAAILLLASYKPAEKTVETDSKVASDNKIYGQQLILEPGVEFPKLKGGLKRVQRKLEYPPGSAKKQNTGPCGC